MLLLDHNISHKLIKDPELCALYQGWEYVYPLGLHDSDDEIIWKHAQKNKLIIISKDNDFYRISAEKGYPPSVVKLSVGNCSTNHIKAILHKYHSEICRQRQVYC